jgi:ureidoglycolate lyase
VPILGVVHGDSLSPLSGELSALPNMIALIRGWEKYGDDVQKSSAPRVPLSTVTLLPPIVRPEKMFAIGLNYADHVKETGRERPDQQVWFAKHANCIVGPNAGVQIPLASSKIDYEVELVVVIGKRGRHISRAAAKDHVFGYCIGNDVSVRDWQRHSPQWVLGKSFDTHAPIGPWITTADEVGDPHRLNIRCLVNGEIRQESNTRELVFNVWDQIEHLSKAMTLEPGDLIFTGTPGGVGGAMKPPRFLVAGDRVRCEIDELGALDNTMVPEVAGT